MISGSKRVSELVTQGVVAAALVTVSMAAVVPAGAQTHTKRRETNANRQARIARLTAETYAHRWEAGFGGGYQRMRSGPFDQQNNAVSFFGSTQYSLTPKFGVIGEIAGGYGNAKLSNGLSVNLNNIGKPYAPQISQYTFTAGPTYRVVAKEKYSVSGFATAGLGLGKFDSGSKGFTSAELGLWPTGEAVAFTAGVSLDYNFYPNLAFRVKPKFIGTTFGDSFQANKGIDFGVLYRFGKIK